MTILNADQTHIPGMLRLLLQVGQVHHRLRPDIFREGMQKYDAAALQALLADPLRPIYIAWEQGEVVGYCFCAVKEFSDPDRVEFYIDDLCVDAQHRRRGIAGALYRHALDQAKARGCHSLTLNVWCGNDSAMAFYEKQGLRPRNIMMETRL